MTSFPPCAICRSRSRTTVHRLPVGHVVECPGCQLVSLVQPKSGELVTCDYAASYYARDLYGGSVGYRDYFGSEAISRNQIAQDFAHAIRFNSPHATSILDIGCGAGYLVSALSRVGYAAAGIDTSPYVIQRARAQNTGTLFVGDIAEEALHLPGEPYDLVTMLDTLEHVRDPIQFVRSALGRMAMKGTIIVLTPRHGGQLSTDQGERYVHFNSDHPYYFSDNSLRRILHDAAPHSVVEIAGVIEFMEIRGVPISAATRTKYTTERDSMVAVAKIGST